MNVIYTVTSVFLDAKGHVERTRCVGWYLELRQAKNAVINDVGSLSEAGYYNYIVIEESPEGIYGVSQQDYQWWFSHNDVKNCWESCVKPENQVGIVGFGVG
jgi:hypothetical protein